MNRERISYQMPFGLRMLPDLRDRVAASAKANNRSLNSEIVYHLERALAQPASAGDTPSKSDPADARTTS